MALQVLQVLFADGTTVWTTAYGGERSRWTGYEAMFDAVVISLELVD